MALTPVRVRDGGCSGSFYFREIQYTCREEGVYRLLRRSNTEFATDGRSIRTTWMSTIYGYMYSYSIIRLR
jgi:hypothetical protein